MHLHIIIIYATLIWVIGGRPIEPLTESVPITLSLILIPILALPVAAALMARKVVKSIKSNENQSEKAHLAYHRTNIVIRTISLSAYAITFVITPWVDWWHRPDAPIWLLLFVDIVVVLPYLLSVILIWNSFFPVEHLFRETISEARQWEGKPPATDWNRWEYLVFQIRHQLLIVVIPMTVLLAAYAVARRYDDVLIAWSGVPWAPDIILGAVGVIMFLMAPIILRYTWATSPLPQGDLRDRLQAICERIGLKKRDILVWHSGGSIVNAAVLGVFARVRFVLLSDGLLDSMNDQQIEAVFGHEAGHVRHHHIQYFGLFAIGSMLTVSGVMELLHWASRNAWLGVELKTLEIQGTGLVLVAVLWGVGFGWVSRRFERQADWFGALCVTPAGGCHLPCSVHSVASTKESATSREAAICAHAAEIFASALLKVADLNGIPPSEPSWRHSSIASRVRFLTRMAGDPGTASRFAKLIGRIKTVLLSVAVISLVVAAGYLWWLGSR
jgi:STE24 endopeptidase